MANKMSRSPWMWAFLIMFMIWGVWILLPQPEHLSVDQASSHLKSWSGSDVDSQAATSPQSSKALSSTDDDDDSLITSSETEATKVTEDTVVADAIKSLLDDQNTNTDDNNQTTSDSPESKEEASNNDDDDDDDEEEEIIATQTANLNIEATPLPNEVNVNEPQQTQPTSPPLNNGVGIVVQIHDETATGDDAVEKVVPDTQQQEPTPTAAAEQGEASASDYGDDDASEDAVATTLTAVSWPAATEI